MPERVRSACDRHEAADGRATPIVARATRRIIHQAYQEVETLLYTQLEPTGKPPAVALPAPKLGRQLSATPTVA